MTTPEIQNTYEEFRAKYERSPGESPLRPWHLLSEAEQESWEDQYRRYTGEADTTDGIGGVQHGDPVITDRHKPIA